MIKIRIFRINPTPVNDCSYHCTSASKSQEEDLSKQQVEKILIENLRDKLSSYMNQVDMDIILEAKREFSTDDLDKMRQVIFSEVSDLSSVIEVITKITSAIESKIKSKIERLTSLLPNNDIV